MKFFMSEWLLLPIVRIGPITKLHVSLPLSHSEFWLVDKVESIVNLHTQGWHHTSWCERSSKRIRVRPVAFSPNNNLWPIISYLLRSFFIMKGRTQLKPHIFLNTKSVLSTIDFHPVHQVYHLCVRLFFVIFAKMKKKSVR